VPYVSVAVRSRNESFFPVVAFLHAKPTPMRPVGLRVDGPAYRGLAPWKKTMQFCIFGCVVRLWNHHPRGFGNAKPRLKFTRKKLVFIRRQHARTRGLAPTATLTCILLRQYYYFAQSRVADCGVGKLAKDPFRIDG